MNTTTITGPEPHRTEKLSRLLDKAFFVYHPNGQRSFEGSPELHKFLSALIHYLEFAPCPAQDASKSAAHAPPTNTKTETAPNAGRPITCWDDLPGYKELYNDSAASPAAACARACDLCGGSGKLPKRVFGEAEQCPKCMSKETPSPSDTQSGGASSSSPVSSSPIAPPAADAPAVPEWESKLRFIATDHRAKIVSGFPRITINTLPEILRDEADAIDAALLEVAALRTSRDHWRERAEKAEDAHMANKARYQGKLIDSEARIRDLEAQVAKQMTTIDALTKPKPADDWRERITCLVREAVIQQRPRYIADEADEYAAAFRNLLDRHFPTPPPDAAEGGRT